MGISPGLARTTVGAKVNGTIVDVFRPFTSDSKLELFKFNSDDGKHMFWHSSAHILGQAIELLFPEARLCIGPPIEEGGFYYDVYLPGKDNTITPDHIKQLQTLVNKIIKAKQPFERIILKDEALDMFKENKFKLEIINKKVPDNDVCTAYRCGPLIDLCKGPHIRLTSDVKTLKVLKSSSAYWLGNNQMKHYKEYMVLVFQIKN